MRSRIGNVNTCQGCNVFTNVCLINILNGFIWTGAVIYSMANGQRSPWLEQFTCTLEANCIQFVSCFLLVTLAGVCLHNVRMGAARSVSVVSKWKMTLVPWFVTIILYIMPRLLNDGVSGTYSGFYRLASLEADGGGFGADLELMMCGQHVINDRMLIGLQYCLVVAPVSLVILACGIILSCRYWNLDEKENFSLDFILLPHPCRWDTSCTKTDDKLLLPQYTEKQPIPLDETSLSSEKAPISDEVVFLKSEPVKCTCTYDRIKLVLGAVLLVNLTWQCAIRPLMITHSAQIGNYYYVDVGSSMLVGIQASYLPLYCLLN